MTKSPRRLKQQVQETVGEQVRDIPLYAVRLAMFGVGRALLLGDRLTKDYKEITEGDGVRPVIGRAVADVQHTATQVLGKVGGLVRGEDEAEDAAPAPVRRPRPEPAAARPEPAAGGKEISVGKPAAAPRPAPAPRPTPGSLPKPDPAAPETPAQKDAEAEFEPKPELKPAAPAEAAALAAELPVPDYDAATIPQLRARLRGLSADQVKLLREYEKKHAARPDVLRMYENRILKLNGHN
ncbi:hypothetical protein [Actinomadura parmotrematis]|uniref:Lipid droplet-associated protein n=1 Tax=Actinomadura parmotrematis TaxID=2864039 RepID=A0ABS7FMA6_9ACTN|nr:hypothetical protein [Actinomadura parmotrematis]MBW8481504.1 hypothetical protein [Actinomadura parmotrematis]